MRGMAASFRRTAERLSRLKSETRTHLVGLLTTRFFSDAFNKEIKKSSGEDKKALRDKRRKLRKELGRKIRKTLDADQKKKLKTLTAGKKKKKKKEKPTPEN